MIQQSLACLVRDSGANGQHVVLRCCTEFVEFVSFGNVVLSPFELDAFRADYVEEKSFRGEYVSSLMYLIAVTVRVREEQRHKR